MVSHELKTPLTSLTALVQVLKAKLKKSEDPFISRALDNPISR
ncbi:histidine kinase dimerization/phospho-acceptor domain-containing protein [Mucilaginibacter antarcticus]|uniref:histidine kinase n=1 Tax=Mucilaginibacter antarcticus TaxID=1855725 RepID=A0ABW5XR07_9SPHI